MELLIEPEAPPLKKWEDGSIRVGGTRVLLEVLIGFYNDGYTAEMLAEAFPAVPIAEIHATLAYYHKHKAEVDRYVAEVEDEGKQIQQAMEAQPGYSEKIESYRKRAMAFRKARQ